MRRLRSIMGWRSRSQISLEIRAVPADADPFAFRVARSLADWFQQAGIDATVQPVSEEQLLRKVLLDHDFDAFVGRLAPAVRDPDGLYPLLHSRYVDESGWQNPFGYANLSVDEDLERQRRARGGDRVVAATALQETLARTQPFTTLAFPEDVRAVRESRVENWRGTALNAPRGFLELSWSGDEEAAARADRTLRGVATDERPTENLNPLTVEFRRSGVVTGLLYDTLGVPTDDGTVRPWLATDWTFSDAAKRPRATVSLREDLSWHDGEPLTASDVAFTFSLLEDTTGSTVDGDGGTESEQEPTRVPAPRFRGRSGLVDTVTARDPTTAVFEFTDSSPAVATSAFTVPILPAHVWAERRTEASISGVEFGPATEAIVTNNVPPVGSGPLEFARNTPGESLELQRYDDHFLRREDAPNVPQAVRDGPAFDRLTVQVVASDAGATELVVDGDADVTMTSVAPSSVPRIGRADDTGLLVSRSDTPYVVGYNVRNPPLSNTRFRNTLVRLVDKAAIADDVFDGYAAPAASPLAGTGWLPETLEWHGEGPVTSFLGSNGELDVERARDAFRDAGFTYDDGALVHNDA